MDLEERYTRHVSRSSHTHEGRQIFMDDHHFLDLQRRFTDIEPDLFSSEVEDYYSSYRSKVKEADARKALKMEKEKKGRADAAARERVDQLERDLPRVRVVEPGQGRRPDYQPGVTHADRRGTGGA